jgi:Flp pilus assembly pilin Flp
MARRGHWLAQDDAQGLVEYALILALTSLGMVLAVLLLRDSLGSPVRGSSNALDGITAEAPAGAVPGEPGGGPLDPGTAAGAGGSTGRSGGAGKGNPGQGAGNGGADGDWETRHPNR